MANRAPNILLITCHDLGCWLGCYGVSTVRTPNLDSLASSGIRFSRSFCVAPQCSPSRATLLTGRYPHCNGMMGLAGSNYAWDLNPEERHLGQVLRAQGYATALVGVHHESHARSPAEIRARCGTEELVPDFPKGKAPPAEILSREALRLMSQYARWDRPFYMQLGYYEPHRQHSQTREEHDYVGFLGDYMNADDCLGVTVPQYLRDTAGTREEVAELQGAVGYVDRAIGVVLDGLRELGLQENTLVLFTADHGVDMPRAKLTLYDPGIEVPLILRLPARGWAGRRVMHELVSNVDVFPTLLDLLGIGIDAEVQGRSLLPLLDGGEYEPREVIFAEKTYHGYYDPMRCVRTDWHKLIVNFSTGRVHQNCTQSWRPRVDPAMPADLANVTYGHETIELYDLANDPWELHNVAADPSHGETRVRLLAKLRDWMQATDDPLLRGAVTSPMHRRALEVLSCADNRYVEG